MLGLVIFVSFSLKPINIRIGLGVIDYDVTETHAKEFPISQIIQHPGKVLNETATYNPVLPTGQNSVAT